MTVMTTERQSAAPVQQQAGSLAIRPDQTVWSPQQEAVLRQSGISDEVTKAELAGFLHLCQRTGLDPFSRQIYLIGRYDKRKQRTVFTPQTGIDGYRVIAQRVTGQTAGTYGYEDTLWCDASGRWRDVWLSDEPPAAAKVTVVRNGARFSAVARFSEYAETWPDGNLKSMWAKMPAGQIAKCCEALALRKAFPHDLAGVYTSEEMAQADNPEPAPQFQRQAPAQDQWEQATPAPAPVQQMPPDVVAAGVADIPAESLTPAGRDYLAEVHKAADQATARQIYDDAKAEGAVPVYLAQIAQVGMTKPQVAPTGPPTTAPEMVPGDPGRLVPGLTPEMVRAAVQDPSQLAGQLDRLDAARQAATASPTPEALPGTPDDPRARGMAVVEMYAAGRDNSLTPGEVQQAFTARYGHGVDAATAAELAEFTADLTAAAGAR